MSSLEVPTKSNPTLSKPEASNKSITGVVTVVGPLNELVNGSSCEVSFQVVTETISNPETVICGLTFNIELLIV